MHFVVSFISFVVYSAEVNVFRAEGWRLELGERYLLFPTPYRRHKPVEAGVWCGLGW